MSMAVIAQFFEQLLPDIQKVVTDFAKLLLEKKAKKKQKAPYFDCEVALMTRLIAQCSYSTKSSESEAIDVPAVPAWF